VGWLNIDSWLGVLNTWNLTRAAGIVCYLLLSLSVVTGLYATVRKKQGLGQGVFPALHLTLGNWGLYTGLFHAGILLFDQYVTIGTSDIAVPFLSSYKTVPMGLGSSGCIC
jgi:methionine sulfoxide reductase heme-binding subunit